MTEYVTCKLCGDEFRMLGVHLARGHGMSVAEYWCLYPGAETVSDSVSAAISESALGNKRGLGRTHSWVPTAEQSRGISAGLQGNQNALGSVRTLEERRAVSRRMVGNKYSLGHKHSDETRRKLSEASKNNQSFLGHHHTEEACKKVSVANTGRVLSIEACKAISDAKKKHWQDPNYVRSVMKHVGPNNSELRLQEILDKHFPGVWKFVGNGDFVVGSHVPDFLNVVTKTMVIEMFGLFWHDPGMFPDKVTDVELVDYYRQYGFDCLVLWEDEAWNEETVVAKVEKLMEGLL